MGPKETPAEEEAAEEEGEKAETPEEEKVEETPKEEEPTPEEPEPETPDEPEEEEEMKDAVKVQMLTLRNQLRRLNQKLSVAASRRITQYSKSVCIYLYIVADACNI